MLRLWNYKVFIIWFFVFLYLGVMSYVGYVQAVTLRFVDETNNISAGYFITIGRSLYTDIFFNHQPMAAWQSALLQWVTRPVDLYDLVVNHRMSVVVWAMGWYGWLLYRFGLKIVPFVVIFEYVKYYLMGHSFLSESFIVYPLVYAVLLTLKRLQGVVISLKELSLALCCLWFVIWSREPYVPLALVLAGCLLISRYKPFLKAVPTVIFILLNVVTVFYVDVQEYLHQVFYINSITILPYEASISGSGTLFGYLSGLLYPLHFLVGGVSSHLRWVGITLSLLYVFIVFLLLKRRAYSVIGLCVFFLFLSALRSVPPGTELYGAFHRIVWFGLFISVVSYFSFELYRSLSSYSKKILLTLWLVIVLVTFGFPSALLYRNIDRESAFTIDYGREATFGMLIKEHTNPSDTAFVYGWDTLVYFVSRRDSAYPKALFLPVMVGVTEYQSMVKEMLDEYPPSAWYTECRQSSESYNEILTIAPPRPEYSRYIDDGKPTCLFLR